MEKWRDKTMEEVFSQVEEEVIEERKSLVGKESEGKRVYQSNVGRSCWRFCLVVMTQSCWACCPIDR